MTLPFSFTGARGTAVSRALFLCGSLIASPVFAQVSGISGPRIRAHVKFLSSDLLEGRGPGERGGALAAEYIASQFALLGLKPAGDNGTYLQKVPLVGVTTESDAQLSTSTGVSLQWLTDFVGQSRQQKAVSDFDGEAVFVGHGITAPEYKWDDYKGVDVKGKVVVLFTNEPESQDPKFFKGRALTYYGRWTYKYEEAARRGAIACIIIHTTPTASYSYEVVRSSWGREDPQVKLDAGQQALAMAGWVTGPIGEKLTGRNLADLLKLSDSRDFKAFDLGFRIKGRLRSKMRDIISYNVAGIVEGSDSKLKSEAVVFSAHWDHLGVGEAVNGDTIYNGAIDNATGCAMILELAHAWAALPQKPRRSAIFLAVTAEEGGLRGSEYYAKHPFIPMSRTAANINYDALFPYGRTKDIGAPGAERTTLWPFVQEAGKRFQMTVTGDPRPEDGGYYRSDHFAFAHAGVPAFSVESGQEFLGKPAGWGEKMAADYNAKNYHQPSDQYREEWDFAGLEQYAKFGFVIGINVANDPKLPTWQPGDEFLAARQASLISGGAK